MNSIQQAQQLGQSVWLDYVRRGLINSGELKHLIDEGITGLTANPTILERAIVGSTDYDNELVRLSADGKSEEEIYRDLAIEDIRAAADLLLDIYERSQHRDGFPCLEISPLVAYDTAASVDRARRLFRDLERPNVMVKVPATPEGIPAIRQLTSEGISVNVTLIFSLEMYQKVKEAYIQGLEELLSRGGDPSRVASVASFFLSRIDTAVDGQLEALIKQGQRGLSRWLGKTAIASARLAYRSFKETFYGERFSGLRGKANVQRLLWASTGTKNPAYSDVMYVEPLIGADTVNTMPLATIYAFLDHGRAAATIEQDVAEAEQSFRGLEEAGIDMQAITDRLLSDGVKAFDDSFAKLMAGIKEKRNRLATPRVGPRTALGEHDAGVKATVADLAGKEVVRRIWREDYTVWDQGQAEIADRLGWLTISGAMREQVPELEAFAGEIREAGFRNIVLLGMGGSSLGAEVLRQVFGVASGFPQMFVLDSTLPEAVKAVEDAIDPAHTLFIVSSKSGTTAEPNILYKYFKRAVLRAGRPHPGHSFIAITDPGSDLARLARRDDFRKVFLNPPDIGGRYSVLSYFGLVPAALIGVDIRGLLDRADSMAEACSPSVPEHENPGLWLGACMGQLAAKGQDKLTLVTSPALHSFGLWAEQLVAESTGKQGKGIIPVAGEPLLTPEDYGRDRLFVYLRLGTDDNLAADAALDAIKSSRPVVVLDMADRLDLGAEFFRWEFATAVAGSVLGIHPFNQPDVQNAKDATRRILAGYARSRRLPAAETSSSPGRLLSQASAGKYLAVQAYVRQTPEVDTALERLRREVMRKWHIATTLGYGPRFLHSTGQLHKGGPNTGLFLQLTTEHQKDLSVPAEPYTLGVVADAQALGDLQALQTLGRAVVSLRLKQGGASEIEEIVDSLTAAPAIP